MKPLKRAASASRWAGFTLIELLTVMAIIAVLAGLILAGAGYAQQKAAAQRASAEIAALSTALESYKVDNGDYPRTLLTGTANVTDSLDPRASFNPSGYANASLVLYQNLSGDPSAANRTAPAGVKVYFEFKATMLQPTVSGTTSGAVTALVDPYGNAYGYSTANNADQSLATPPTPARGYNPTFDLWSTGGQTATTGTAKWITNW